MPMTQTPEQLWQNKLSWGRLRDRARTDLYWLANEVLSPPDSRILTPHAHGCIVDHCQAFTGRKEFIHKVHLSKSGMPRIDYSSPRTPMAELTGSRDNLLLVSRGFLKTTIHTIAHCIQWIINYPEVRILICTATDEKAQMMVGGIKSHFQFNPRFRFMFPELCPDAKKVSDWGSKTEFTIPGRHRRTNEPTVMTASVGKALASTHHDVLKCSDVVTENNVRTQGQVQEVADFFGYLDPLREKYESKDGKPNPAWLDIEGTIYDYSDFYQKTLDAHANGSQPWWRVTRRSCWVDAVKRIPLWPERFPAEQLDRIFAQIGPVLFACTPGEAPILMADFSEKPISEIKVGDQIIGYERDGSTRGWMRMVPAKVEKVTSFYAPVVRVEMEDGSSVRCTVDHKWYTGRLDKGHKRYAQAKIGMRLVQVYPQQYATAEEIQDWRYLAGIIDGEGGCRHGSIFISQSESANPAVSSEIHAVLTRLRITYSIYRRKEDPSNMMFYLQGGRPMRLKLLKYGRPAKRAQIVDGIRKMRSRLTNTENKITYIKPDGYELVYGLKTGTGNYVSQGYASQNSQYELNPITATDGLATPQQIKKFPAHLITELMPRYRVHTTVDLSGMDPTTQGDSTVFSTCGFDRDGRCDVLSIIKGRFTMDQVVNYFFAIAEVYPSHEDFKIQKDHFSRTLWPILQRAQAKRGKWLNIQLTPVSTRISKQQRIRGLQAWFMQGLIRFADNISCMNDVILEILRFPKYEHDDILDTLADQMHNRSGHPVSDVYPDAEKCALPSVPTLKFAGFDPITKDAQWLQSQIEAAHNEYSPMTGAL